MNQNSIRDVLYEALDDSTTASLWRRVMPSFNQRQSTLLIYNTVERLLSGDLLHTVSINDVWGDLFTFPREWRVVGIGTTNWLRRNGEMMPDGTAREINFWWADPSTAPQAHVIDLDERPEELDIAEQTLIKRQAQFPFLALAVCNPSSAVTGDISGGDSIHDWLQTSLNESDIRMAGIQIRGELGAVKTTDAHYLPDTGLDLSGGYVGDNYFRTSEHDAAEWVINGIYVADESLQPFVSVKGLPVHLHGYQPEAMVGGHIVSAEARDVEVTVWALHDVVMQIRNL